MSLIQEMFNKTVHHLRAQGNSWGRWSERGWTFVNPSNPCERCAQGIHMEILQAKDRLSGKLFYHTNSIAYNKLLDRNPKIHLLMLDLQDVFEFKKPETWEIHFKILADRYNLIVPSIRAKKEDKINEQV